MGWLDRLFGKKQSPAGADAEPEEQRPDFEDIDVDRLRALMADGVPVIDVRTPLEYAGYRIEGAVNIPVDNLRRDPSLLPEAPAIFICAAGGRSAFAANLAAQRGLLPAYNVEGGMQAWLEAGLPTAGKGE